jgi:hypothetical protein
MLIVRSLVLFLVFLNFFSEEVFLGSLAYAKTCEDVSAEKSQESLRAFNVPSKESTEKASQFVWLIFVVVAIGFIVWIVLFFYFYEPSYLSKPYQQTEVGERPEGFTPYRNSSRSGEDKW